MSVESRHTGYGHGVSAFHAFKCASGDGGVLYFAMLSLAFNTAVARLDMGASLAPCTRVGRRRHRIFVREVGTIEALSLEAAVLESAYLECNARVSSRSSGIERMSLTSIVRHD